MSKREKPSKPVAKLKSSPPPKVHGESRIWLSLFGLNRRRGPKGPDKR